MTKLQKILHEKGISQVELAKQCGFNKDYINRYIKGHHDITLKRAKVIATVLNIKVDDLI